MFRRLYHFGFRFREAFLYVFFILTSFMAIMSFFYPGDEGIEAYIGIYDESILSAIVGEGLEAGGFLFWVSMQLSIYLYYFLVVAGIRMGARIMPTTKEDGVELTVGSNSLSSRRFFLENTLAAVIVLLLSIIPSYFALFASVASKGGDNSILLERLATSYLFAFVVALVYMSLSAFISVFFFRRDWGVKAGVFYLIYSFIIELVSGSGILDDMMNSYFDTIRDSTGYDMSGFDIGNISINSYVNPTAGLISGDFDWEPIYVALSITILFFALAWWRVKAKEYIEVTSTARNGKMLGLFDPERKTAQKYPIIFEQLRSDFGSLVGWFIFNTAMVWMLPSFLPSKEDLAALLTGFDMPFFNAFTLGNGFRFDYTGFIAMEFLGFTFLYFGMFAMFSAIGIVTKETKNNNQDIVWGSNISQAKIVIQRTITLMVESSILIWGTYGMMRVSETVQDMDIDVTNQFYAFILIWLQYLMIIVLLVGVSMVVIPSKGRTYAIWLYILSYMALIFGYSAEALEWMTYLSVYTYNDVIGVLYGTTDFGEQAMWAAIDLTLATVFFLTTLNYRFKKLDII